MNHLKVVIIDDEPDSISLLKLQLLRQYPEIEVLKCFTNSTRAVSELPSLNPDVIFLDIEMPVLNGFELLEKLESIPFNIIFITAYQQYTIKAFKFNALDYLVKPIETEELINAISKIEKYNKPTLDQLKQLQKQLKGEPINKIAIQGQNGVVFLEFSEILYGEASSNYTKLFLKDERTITISKTLKDIQVVLEDSFFLRIHRQYIINLNHIKYFSRNDSTITMSNNVILPIARNQKEKFSEKFRWL